jgi:DNA repair exonuclease SbcCD nuclease subunit
MKLGLIGDAHLGCADYTDRRRADFVTAFKNAISTCLDGGAEALCLLGDVFDSALTRRSVESFAATMKEVGPILQRLKTEKVPVLAIAGNHEFGRGREAGELGVLESVGLLRVLRGDSVLIQDCAIVGFPWQASDELAHLRPRVRESLRCIRGEARHRVLLLHNFVMGSKFIPSHLGELDEALAQGFDRAFVGHHHDQELLGPFVMPGATEVQNLAEVDHAKAVVIYDTATARVTFRKLPKTREVVVLRQDTGRHGDRDELFAAIAAGLADKDLSRTFVCVVITGQTRGWSVSKAEIHGFLRTLEAFDRFVDVRTTTPTRTATEAVRSVTIDSVLKQEFGKDAEKARRYLERSTDDGFGAQLIDEILR